MITRSAQMPYEWSDDAGDGARRLLIWRHRSLTPQGFAWVIGTAAAALLMPLLAVLGRTAMWGLLPFAVIALAGLWGGVQHGWRGGGTREEVMLTRGRMSVTRHDPGRPARHWQGNPYWARLSIRGDGPVEDYLTLSDGARVIELGAFLSPEERRSLMQDLSAALADLRRAAP
ncbi:DUF2244 domain-containing protein [Paracoccus contaminans]|nr:DUF2244 domain-containing protein [Paracoccus contaminans]